MVKAMWSTPTSTKETWTTPTLDDRGDGRDVLHTGASGFASPGLADGRVTVVNPCSRPTTFVHIHDIATVWFEKPKLCHKPNPLLKGPWGRARTLNCLCALETVAR